MQPDFSKPAFSIVALCGVQFNSRDDRGGEFHSDYRCQLRYNDEQEVVDVRVYLVGRESIAAGGSSSRVVAFLDFERERERCKAGRTFELREGTNVTATGTVHVVAKR